MATGLPGSVIMPLKLEQTEEQAGLLDYACRTSRGAVYLQCTGPAASSPPTTVTLDHLTHCLEPSAHGMPRCNIFPLLPFLGWTPQRVAALADAEEVIAAAEHAKECHVLLDELNAARQAAGLPSLSLTLTAGHADAADGSPPQQIGQGADQPAAQQQDGQQGPMAAEQHAAEAEGPPGPCSRVIGDWPHPHLQFNKVAVGGTFDRLHAGHRLLLAATALVSRQHIFVGITADKLLASKKNRELLETYEEREAAAVGYMKMINPGVTVVAGPLNDPQEPPLCAVDAEFDAIVVSEETIPGAHAINKTRAELGFPPLVIVVIGLIYSRRRAAKLSSTDLREEDASGRRGGARSSEPNTRATMLVRVLKQRGLALLQLAPAAARSATTLGSSRLLGSTGSGVRLHSRGLLATAAQRRPHGTGAASEAAAKQAAAEAAATEPAAGAAAKRQGRRRASSAAPAVVRRGTVVLVESPAKAKKIQGFLGPDYTVLASYGHVRDLPSKPGAVVPNEGFEMVWELTKPAQPRMDAIVAAVKGAERLVLATDPDREGEAISWHLLQELQARKVVNGNVPVERITFTEVTEGAVKDALANPRQISEPLVHAYMARRALDYLFGFHLSPMLWRKVPGARSAGRVQSVALRLVCERENEIEAFQRLKYWSVEADLLLQQGGHIEAHVTEVDGAAPPQPGFLDEREAAAIAKRVGSSLFVVDSISSREQQRQPPAPFTTSTLQQEANNRLGLSAGRTMSLAQQLYEAGHITYMRTDGVSLAPTAVQEIRAAVGQEFGSGCLPNKPREYKSRSKNAQEAHEGIRPTDPSVTAQHLAKMGLDLQAARLYGLIRYRALASQMTPAKLRLVAVDMLAQDGTLRMRSNASCVASPGFLSAYFDPAVINGEAAGVALAAGEAEEEALALEDLAEDEGLGSSALQRRAQQEAERAATAAALAALKKGDVLRVATSAALEHETRPPPRYTEGSLVKALEQAGIGRPSTYAPTLNLLQQRGYVRKEGRSLHAQALGRVLTAFLQAYFSPYVDYRFTSGLEQQLDQVSGGEMAWKEVLNGFWGPFTQQLSELGGVPVKEVIEKLNAAVGDQLIGKDRTCPSCRAELSLKFSGKFRGAPFVGCSTYPDCDYSRPISAPWALHPEPDAQAGADSSSSDGEGEDSEGKRLALEHNFKGHARHLGQCPQTGLHIFLRTGLYGPYVQRGRDDDPLFHRQGLPRNVNTRQVTLEVALAMLALPKDLGPNPATGESVLVTMGKFGPFLRCGAASRALPKGYDPLEITLADALQLLATKQRWSTSQKERKAVVAAAAVADAAANEEASGEQKPKRRGRPATVAKEEAAKAAAQAQAAAALLAPEEDSRREATIADIEARLALDAAANLQIGQLKDALNYTPEEALEAERMATALSMLRRGRGRTGFHVFISERSKERRAAGIAFNTVGSAAKHLSAEWRAMTDEEKKPYDRLANHHKLDEVLHLVGLLEEGQVLWDLPEAKQSELEAEFERRRREHELRQMVLNDSVTLPRPATAYNLFTADTVARKRAETGSGESLVRISEMWRQAPVSVRQKFKLAAAEEQQLYRVTRERMTREQQRATAAAVEAGASSLEAARAGILAATAISTEYAKQQQELRRQQGILVKEDNDADKEGSSQAAQP